MICCITVLLSQSNISKSARFFFADPCLSMFSMTICMSSSRSVGLVREYMLQQSLLHASFGGAEADLDLARCGDRNLARWYSVSLWETLLAAAAAVLALASHSSNVFLVLFNTFSPSLIHSIRSPKPEARSRPGHSSENKINAIASSWAP